MPRGVERQGTTQPAIWQTAPGQPGEAPRWSSGAKTAVGTAVNPQSRVWFTVADGTLNEIYFPDVDTANTRSVRFLVTDGEHFFCDEEFGADHTVEPVEDGIPAYRIESRCQRGKFVLRKEVITDPERDVLLLRVHFEPKVEGLRLYLHIDPQLEDQGNCNTAYLGAYKGVPMLFAYRDGVALSAVASVPFLECTCGYVGQSDGVADLVKHGHLKNRYNHAPEGNVALVAEVDGRASGGNFVAVLGFGGDCAEAGQQTRGGLLQDFEKVLQRFLQEWRDKQAGYAALQDLSGAALDLYRVSAAVLQTHGSKRYPGGYVASLSVPWGFVRGDKEVIGYHVLWPRDLVETAFGKLACGDQSAAVQALFYLACTQEEDGHWAQNIWLDGTPHFDAVQMDSTALPAMLACRLHREGLLGDFDVWPMVQKAAKYLLLNGPCSEEERWEAMAGYSVFTLATEVTALLAVAEVAESLGKLAEADFLRETADAWNEAIEEYTYAEGTEMAAKYAVPGYYLRLSPPKAATTPLRTLNLTMTNKPWGNRGRRAVNVVSPDFLALVRLGLRRADDPRILNTLKVVDGELRYELATGTGWVRSSNDGYGELADGKPFKTVGIGRCWPLLAGERGHYALAAGDRDGALEMLRTMARQTSECGLLPEQVWNGPDLPDRKLFNGKPTGSGMPLAWAHAEYVKLLRSLHEGRVWDMPPTTAKRYLQDGTRSDLTLWSPQEGRTWIVAGKRLRVTVEFAGTVRWTAPDGTRQVLSLEARPFGFYSVTLPTAGLPSGASFPVQVLPAERKATKYKFKVVVR